MNCWLIWFVFIGCVNTENIILKDEYNSTSIQGWKMSGNCDRPWEWLKKYHRWDIMCGNCDLESFYWPPLEANVIYVNLTLSPHISPHTGCPCDKSINVYAYNEVTDYYEFVTKAPTRESEYILPTSSYIHTFRLTNFTDRIKFKFQSLGFCGVINDISVYFKKCDQVAAGLATFEPITAPNDTHALIHAGQCIRNARHLSKHGPSRICFGNGSSTLESGCICKDGFQLSNQTCIQDNASSSRPVKNIILGLVIGITLATVVIMSVVYRFKKKQIPPSGVETSSREFNNNVSEHCVQIHNDGIYETICEANQMHCKLNCETPEHNYDVFICYSSNDRPWVRDTLLKELERKGIKACIDYRDFLVGAYICQNITDAIYGSRKTIAVLSPDFLESVYCKDELSKALSRMADHQVIPVLYRTCDVPNNLKDKTYLEWCHDDVKPYFWQQLIKAIDSSSNTVI